MGFEIHSLKTMTKDSEIDPLQEQIAWDILQRFQGLPCTEIAWVTHKEQIYFAVTEPSKVNSAVVKLIQHIFDQHIDHSFFILRGRIFSNVILSETSLGMVRIAAKRVQGKIQPKDHGIKYAMSLESVGSDNEFYLNSRHVESLNASVNKTFESTGDIKKSLQDLELLIDRGEILHDHNRPIGVIATDENLNLLGWSANSNSKNKTLHAEVRLVQEFLQVQKKTLPRGTQIFVSLKPCRMCAAMIAEACEDAKSISVKYLRDDPGSMARGTALDLLNVGKLWE